jgi:hypothetical protein
MRELCISRNLNSALFVIANSNPDSTPGKASKGRSGAGPCSGDFIHEYERGAANQLALEPDTHAVRAVPRLAQTLTSRRQNWQSCCRMASRQPATLTMCSCPLRPRWPLSPEK